MDFEQRLRKSLVARKPGGMFTAKVLARIARSAAQRRSRFIVIGAVLAMGAAASLLAWRLLDVQTPVEVTAIVAVPEPGHTAEEPVAPAMMAVNESVSQPLEATPPTDDSARYTVVVMPLRQDAQDASKRVPVQALYAAVLDELRKVPGLVLRTQGESGDDESVYVLTVIGLDTTVVPAGGVLVRAPDGSTSCIRTQGPEKACGVNMLDGQKPVTGISIDTKISAGGGLGTFKRPDPVSYDDHVWVKLTLREPHSGGTSGRTISLLADGAAMPQSCGNRAQADTSICKTPAEVAANQVLTMRLNRFPRDAALYRNALAHLASANQQVAGDVTLPDVLSGLIGDGRTHSRLDAETVRTLSRYLAGLPAETRANAWKTLTLASHPAMVAPLVESLRHDKDQQVRLAALANLAANYSTDPVVQRAFEEIGREDPDLVMRATVRRALYGPEQWRTDLRAALNDTRLPYEARLAPLLVNTTTGSSRQALQESGSRQALLQEQQVLGPLMMLIREHLQDHDHAKATGDALGLLTDIDHPAVFDLFQQIARETSLPLQVSMQVRNWANNHRDDPRVPQNLPRIEATVSPEFLERMKKYVEETGQLPVLGPGPVSPESGAGSIFRFTPPAQ